MLNRKVGRTFFPSANNYASRLCVHTEWYFALFTSSAMEGIMFILRIALFNYLMYRRRCFGKMNNERMNALFVRIRNCKVRCFTNFFDDGQAQTVARSVAHL